MFWFILIACILGGLAGLMILVMIAGRFLPEKYEAELTMTFQRPPEYVWAALCDYRKHPLSGAMAKRIDDLPPRNGLPCWAENIGSSSLDVTTVVSDPPRLLVRELADRVVPMTARGEVRLERLATGCRVTARNDTRIRRGTWHVPIFRVILTVTKGHRSALRKYWKKIARDLGETGG